jgi:type III pantothenate kinase
MLLAVDIGNSAIKFGIFDGDELVIRFSIPTTSDVASIFSGISTRIDVVTNAIVCSVVPDAAQALRKFLSQRQIATTLVSNYLDFGLTINYRPLSSLGTDRLVNALAASQQYGVPAVVCSFGTATTIDVIDKDRSFLGGIVCPGLQTSVKALNLNTSQLPEVSIMVPDRLIGTSTESSIRSGVVFGHVAMFEGLSARFTKELDDRPTVIATGGFAPLMQQLTPLIDRVDMDLTLNGLRILTSRLAQT